MFKGLLFIRRHVMTVPPSRVLVAGLQLLAPAAGAATEPVESAFAPGAALVGEGLVADDQAVSFGIPEWERRRPAVPERPIASIASSRQLGTREDFGLVAVIATAGPLLLVGDELTDPHISVIDIATGKVTARLGRDGEGPGEFQAPHMVAPDPEKPTVRWVFDFRNVRWTAVSLDGSPSIVEERSLAGVPWWPETPIWTGPSEVLIQGVYYGFPFLKAKIAETGRITSIRRFTGPQPFTEQDVSHGAGLRFANRSFMALRPSAGMFVLAYQFGNQIDVFSTTGAIIGRTHGPYDVDARFRVADDRFFWEEDSQYGYAEAYGTQRFFYLRWSGRRMNEPRHETTELHQYDWEGRFLRAFELDHDVLAFAVSDDDDQLWGYVENPYPVIREWNIPPFLRGNQQ